MGDIDRRDTQLVLELLEFDPHLCAEFGIQIRQRLVEQKHFGISDDCPTERDALLLAPGEIVGFAIQQLTDSEHLGGRLDRLSDL